MARGICKLNGYVAVQFSDGCIENIEYQYLKQLVITRQITLDNMYISDNNRLLFINDVNKSTNIAKDAEYNLDRSKESNRRAG